MSANELLADFRGRVACESTDAPDEYPSWDNLGYPWHRQELLRLWSLFKQSFAHRIEAIDLIEPKITAAIECFDRGERQPGRSLLLEVYNILNQTKWR